MTTDRPLPQWHPPEPNTAGDFQPYQTPYQDQILDWGNGTNLQQPFTPPLQQVIVQDNPWIFCKASAGNLNGYAFTIVFIRGIIEKMLETLTGPEIEIILRTLCGGDIDLLDIKNVSEIDKKLTEMYEKSKHEGEKERIQLKKEIDGYVIEVGRLQKLVDAHEMRRRI